MLASSIIVSEHNSPSDSLCDVGMEHSHTCSSLPLASSHHSCADLQSSSSNVDVCSEVDEYPQIFNCNICMHVPHDPVVTICGHLFCWPCLFYQLSLLPTSKECPVCKADVQDRIVPLYGCGTRAGYSPDCSAEGFHGIHIPCRPSATRSIEPITCTNASRLREPNPTMDLNEMRVRLSAHSGFCASILRFGLAYLPLQNRGFFCRYANIAVSHLVQRRRFNNEKEFVLHWVFILVATVAIAVFLAC